MTTNEKNQKTHQTVAILGASANPERYSHRAWRMLHEYGHQTILVNPGRNEIEGEKVYPTLAALRAITPVPMIDTLTMYVNPVASTAAAAEILALKPRRVIFNPGSENPELESKLRAAGIAVEEACTLVLLRTNQFAQA